MDVCRVYLIFCSPEDSHSMAQVSDILGHLRASIEDEERGKSSYLAILTSKSSPYEESTVFNKWLKICHPVPTTPLATPSRVSQTYSSITMKDLINSLTLDKKTQTRLTNKRQSNNDIHWLLDNTPWNSESYVLMNTVVLIPKSSSLSSFSIESYGELLRLRTWCNSCIYFITSSSSDMESVAFETNHESFTWADLSTSLPAYIGSLTVYVIRALSSNIIWKGPMHIPEYKTKGSPTPNAITLPGLTISLNKYPSDVYSAVGVNIDHAHQPSHLELVQVVDINDVPPLWISPVRVELSLDPSFNHTPSFHLFNKLFLVPSSTTGVLLRLHMKGPSVFQTQCEYSSDKWHLHILEKEPSNGIPTYSYLSHLSDLPGFLLLLVYSQPTSSKSCDARLLWKRQSLLNVGNTVKQLFSTKRNDANVGNGNDMHVNKPANETGQKLSLDKTSSGGSTLVISTELDDDVSSIPEIHALRTLETVLKKQMKRKDTSELTLGGVVAPPPSSVSTVVPTSIDLLDCFTDDGRSVAMDLSPVAMNSSDQDELRPLHMIVPSEPSDVSYKKVLGSTPRTAKKYHGVSYCFSEEDADRESKLVKIQSCYVTKERSSNCSNYNIPIKGTELRNKKKRISNQEPLKENETSSLVATNTKEKNKMKTRTHSSTTHPISNILNIRPRSQTGWSRSRSLTTGFQITASNSHITTGSRPCSHITGSHPYSQTTGLRPRSQTTGSYTRSQTTASRKRSLDTMNDESYSKLKGSKARRSLNIAATDGKNSASLQDKAVTDNVSSNAVTTSVTDNNTSNTVSTTFTDEETDINSPNSIFLCDDTAKPTNTDRQRPSTSHHGLSSNLATTSSANYKKKKLLEKVMASVLRTRGLSKGDKHFTNCYDRLFKICKVYVKDLKAPSSSLQNSSLKDQITKIVESNIQQVIDFELQNK